MNNRLSIGLLCLCALLAGGLLRSAIPTASAQSITPTPAQAERYSIAASPDNLYFADSQTGRLWYYEPVINGKGGTVKDTWLEIHSPVAAASQKP